MYSMTGWVMGGGAYNRTFNMKGMTEVGPMINGRNRHSELQGIPRRNLVGALLVLLYYSLNRGTVRQAEEAEVAAEAPLGEDVDSLMAKLSD